MAAAGVPVAPGTADPAADVDTAVAEAARIGYPVMVKAAAGGGGMGMAVGRRRGGAARPSTRRCAAFAERMFGDGSVLLERYFPSVRHVEVQILGLADGRVVALGERECSVQRRNQKLVEESPSPASMLDPGAARRPARRGGAGRRGGRLPQRGHGRVPVRPGHRRLLLPGDEHPAAGRAPGHRGGVRRRPGRGAAAGRRPACAPTFDPDTLVAHGHAIELRVNAEDPKRFLPGPGAITDLGRADRRGRAGRLRLRPPAPR